MIFSEKNKKSADSGDFIRIFLKKSLKSQKKIIKSQSDVA